VQWQAHSDQIHADATNHQAQDPLTDSMKEATKRHFTPNPYSGFLIESAPLLHLMLQEPRIGSVESATNAKEWRHSVE
jgi:hypothetical protein